MARILTAGAEMGAMDPSSSTAGAGDGWSNTSGTGTISSQTTTKRSGASAYKCSITGTSSALVSFGFTGVPVGTTAFVRGYFRFLTADGWPTAKTLIFNFWNGTRQNLYATVSSTGVLSMFDNTDTQVGGTGQLVFDTWHRIEMKCLVPAASNGTAALHVDGTTVVADTTANVGNAAINALNVGPSSTFTGAVASTATVYVDDIAMNDSTGTAQNTYPGDGAVVMLVPASDNARTNWTTDSAGTASLFSATDNKPPTGIADTTVGSGLHQIRDAVSSATDNYDANLQSYIAAGVPVGANINLVRALMSNSAAATASAPSMALFLVSNAGGTTEGAETSYVSAGAASTWATGWTTRANPHLVMTTQPVLSNSPVLRVGKRTASTRIAMCCLMGLLAEYVIPPLPPGQSHARHLNARSRAPARGRF